MLRCRFSSSLSICCYEADALEKVGKATKQTHWILEVSKYEEGWQGNEVDTQCNRPEQFTPLRLLLKSIRIGAVARGARGRGGVV
ncbi:hypothetical protein NDU88_003815 [Pleurodeles waltl]|uniref:Uncharacterized protein n=1 Tax=Pleurodeles waltl TaxID=8319 RepID=A0AAV7LGU5_PLEWA|nr:hypothetical protein NDU88_003815 [Pleurodeles waltl]